MQLKIISTGGKIDISPAFHGQCGLQPSWNDVVIEVRHK